MPSLGWLPSMFAGMSRQQNKETKEQKRDRINLERQKIIDEEKRICANSMCRNCRSNHLIFDEILRLAKCGYCGEEFPIESLKY